MIPNQQQNAPWPVVARPGAVPNNIRQEIKMRDRKSTGDQLVAPATAPVPPVEFADDETAQTVLNPIRQTYDNAVAWAAQHQAQADAAQADVDKWRQEIEDRQREIREREAWIEMRSREQQAAKLQVQRGQNAAKGAADTLALLGSPVPPANGELSHAPDVTLARFNGATDEQREAEGVRS